MGCGVSKYLGLLILVFFVVWGFANLAPNVGGMKSCRLRAIPYQAVKNLMRAKTLK